MSSSRRKQRNREAFDPALARKRRRKQHELKDKRTIEDSVTRLGGNRYDLGKVRMTFDGVEVTGFDKVLRVGEADPKENGIWIATSGSWKRP